MFLKYMLALFVMLVVGLDLKATSPEDEHKKYLESCVDGLLHAYDPPVVLPSLLQYEPTEPLDENFAQPYEFGMLVGRNGRLKYALGSFRWYNAHEMVTQYGLPYYQDGKWWVDFRFLGMPESPYGDLWAMPALDFYEGIKEDVGNLTYDAFLATSPTLR